MSHLKVGQGGTIPLEATYKDGTGTAVDPDTPLVDIVDSTDTEIVTNAVPTQVATGQYRYDYAVDVAAPLGVWTAHWTGVINSVLVADDDSFEVVAAGDVDFDVDWPTPADLATLLGLGTLDAAQTAKAQAHIDQAIAAFKSTSGQQIELGSSTHRLAGTWGEDLVLPQRPVVSVAQVVVNGTTLAADDWEWNTRSIVRRGSLDDADFDEGSPPIETPFPHAAAPGIPRNWGGPSSTVTVTYTHGYSSIPDEIAKAVLAAAARGYLNPGGVIQEAVGSYSVTFGRQAGPAALLPHERKVARRYRVVSR